MSSQLLSALAKLDDSIRVLEERLHCLGAGLDVSKQQFIQNVTEARQDVDAVREMIRAKRPDVDWTDRQSLEKLIRDLEAAEAGQKELCLRKLLELAEELNAGTITHRLKSRVTALEALRAPAIQELLTEAANDEPKELPGPAAPAWMHWAFGLQEDATAAQFSDLEKNFPALVGFVSEMEESYWQPRESSHEMLDADAVSELPSVPQMTVQPPPLSESAPAFAARYGHLSAAKASPVETAVPTNTVGEVPAQRPEVQAPKPPVSITTDSSLKETQPSTSILADIVKVPVASSVMKDSAQAAEPEALESTFNFSSYSLNPEDAVQVERKGFRFNRSVLITAGVIAAVVLVVVVISAVSGSVSAKRSSSHPETVASDSAKETPAAAPAAPVSDIELVGQIEQKLKTINGGSIYVTVQHGTAILEGQVPSQEALSQAEELTLQASQIKVVRNRLQVAKTAAPRSTSVAAKPGTPNPQ